MSTTRQTGPQPGAYGAVASPPQTRNVLGALALTAGILLIVAGVGQQLVAYALPNIMADRGLGAQEVATVLVPFQITTAALGLTACVTGALGLGRRNAPHRAAAAGLALGASAVVTAIVAILGPLAISAA